MFTLEGYINLEKLFITNSNYRSRSTIKRFPSLCRPSYDDEPNPKKAWGFRFCSLSVVVVFGDVGLLVDEEEGVAEDEALYMYGKRNLRYRKKK